ncbi:hypothetical protein RHMOL_Rhmol13G0053300 [Rhododendron molle]|uniref:Uncharacterized protein n=1 Tax=Rhododendron molle TaxID=49168 RepID=A0ACC0L4K4_RHOML|nr:hypothetical protein RHMOL_Rhmol13G0053300 [Rhododendron molle]
MYSRKLCQSYSLLYGCLSFAVVPPSYKWNGIDEGKVCPFASERIHELDGKVYQFLLC